MRSLVGLLLLTATLHAQDRFRISGVVTDTEGSSLPDASIAVEGQTGLSPARAGADGRFEITGLSAGRHTVSVSLPGFRTETQTIEIGRSTAAKPMTFKLRVGLLTEALFVLP